MRFFRRIAGILGLGKDESQHESKDEDEDNDVVGSNRVNVEPIHGAQRRGFSVPAKVAVERPSLGPVLVPCDGDGGVQGLKWYAKRLRVDEDGDIADEFLEEVSIDTTPSGEDQGKPWPKFQVKYSTRHAKVKNQALTLDGRLQQCVETEGKLQWV